MFWSGDGWRGLSGVYTCSQMPVADVVVGCEINLREMYVMTFLAELNIQFDSMHETNC